MAAAVVATSGVHATTWVLLGLSGVLGLLAMISPNHFQRIATNASHWFDTQKWIERLDRRYDIDRYVLPHSRVLGALVVASAVFLAGLLYRHGL